MLCDEVSQLLRHWTLAKFLARKPPSGVVILHDDQSLVEVLSLFARHNILSGELLTRPNQVISTCPCLRRHV